MKKTVVYWGPKRAFRQIVPAGAITLTELALRSDARQRVHLFKIQGRKTEEPEASGPRRDEIPCAVACSDEYAAISENALNGFLPFMSQYEVDELYLQNPPVYLVEQLAQLPGEITLLQYQYRAIDTALLRRFNNEYDAHIIGQPKAKKYLLTALFPLCRPKRRKPVVMLLCGPSGVGKTETAKFLAQLLQEEPFRRQLSMYHSSEFATYLFGGRHAQNCLGRELLERESNVLLLDEFDKTNPVFHSAFYQLFDEGIFQDKNYRVELNNSVIFCTSNYENAEEAQKSLGLPLYFRFDAVIQFAPLDSQACQAIVRMEWHRQRDMLEEQERRLLDQADLLPALRQNAVSLCNARAIKQTVADAISGFLLEQVLSASEA